MVEQEEVHEAERHAERGQQDREGDQQYCDAAGLAEYGKALRQRREHDHADGLTRRRVVRDDILVDGAPEQGRTGQPRPERQRFPPHAASRRAAWPRRQAAAMKSRRRAWTSSSTPSRRWPVASRITMRFGSRARR